jgi:para-nitrobenzyl esterase
MGAAHASEIAYKFNNVQPSSGTPLAGAGGGDANASKAARNMSEFWSTFARTGQPAAKGQPKWPAYTTSTRATMLIDAECKVVDDPFSLERQVWEIVDRP